MKTKRIIVIILAAAFLVMSFGSTFAESELHKKDKIGKKDEVNTLYYTSCIISNDGLHHMQLSGLYPVYDWSGDFLIPADGQKSTCRFCGHEIITEGNPFFGWPIWNYITSDSWSVYTNGTVVKNRASVYQMRYTNSIQLEGYVWGY